MHQLNSEKSGAVSYFCHTLQTIYELLPAVPLFSMRTTGSVQSPTAAGQEGARESPFFVPVTRESKEKDRVFVLGLPRLKSAICQRGLLHGRAVDDDTSRSFSVAEPVRIDAEDLRALFLDTDERGVERVALYPCIANCSKRECLDGRMHHAVSEDRHFAGVCSAGLFTKCHNYRLQSMQV